MIYADLHIHSSYSDGIYTPEEILKLAVNNKIKCISITDHDSIIAQEKVLNNAVDFLNIIPGIELSSKYNDSEIHILGYFIDIKNDKLNNTLNNLKRKRIERTIEILDKLKLYGIDLDINELPVKSSTIGRGNIAQLMIKKGYVENKYEAFSRYLAKDKCAYIDGEKLSCKEAINIIMESGGIPVLAHPGKIYRDIEIEKMIKEFKCYGIKGIEVYHPSHTRDKINYFYNISKKYKLLITGGSDFHGEDNSRGYLGCKGISKELLEKLKNYDRH